MESSKIKRCFGLKRERIADKSQHVYHFGVEKLPEIVDLRPLCNPVLDQGDLGACSSFGLCSAYDFGKGEDHQFQGSHLFLYWNERNIEHQVNTDSGAAISDGIKALEKWGICSETLWSYDITKFKVKPPPECYAEAKNHKVVKAIPIAQTEEAMKQCLASGLPIVLGIQVYDEFESDEVAKTGIVPMPGPNSQDQGGHCILAVGFNSQERTWLMKNSWGTNWGQKGYFTLPFDYLTDQNLTSDLWCIVLDKVKKD
jgi:C1A family cysteine protease